MSFHHNNEEGGIRRDDVEGGVFDMVAKFENFNGQGLWYDKEWNNTDRMVESSIEQNQEMINSKPSFFSQFYPLILGLHIIEFGLTSLIN